MYSPNRHMDKELLHEIGLMILAIEKHRHRPLVEKTIEGFAQSYKALEAKIKTHDYTKEDEIYERSVLQLN